MSVIIEGMDMPKSCFDCKFRVKLTPDDIGCIITEKIFEETFEGTILNRKRDVCPLVNIDLDKYVER